MIEVPGARTCAKTGVRLVPADGALVYRVAQDKYTFRSGPLSSPVNKVVGSLPDGEIESRGRFDTVGRTVYFGDTPEVCFAETLQGFRLNRQALVADAQAAGQDVDEFIRDVTSDAVAGDRDTPWAVGGDWQRGRSLLYIRLPLEGWWVQIDHPATLNALHDALAAELAAAGVPLLTLSAATGENRAATTLLAQCVRDLVLDDGSLPLGISFPSKTAYGRCLAWWNRREDDDLMPSDTGPRMAGESDNVDTPAFRKVCEEWGLPILDGRLAY
ncbi:RES domain-containing protein [Oerskovia sp. Sa1BUA8]|uniref:RES domain-containing protein n=1 Tax=Oerskovia douganii TaxID=2762210 RepID=A0A9D5U8W2_9CELL|nr:RES domain-containing protein [Oerskovia douganii]MBE7700055.1 RES domain-containing protein [Oerskovia douganii]